MGENRLILMRHAKSDWDSGTGDDFSRPLSARGVKDAIAVGQWLGEHGYLAAEIACSPARRTRETLLHLGAGCGEKLSDRATYPESLYHSSVPTLLEVLSHHGQSKDLLVLGHNPGLEELLWWLVSELGEYGQFNKIFPTGTVYVLRTPEQLSKLGCGSCQIEACQRPKLLR